MHAERIGSGDVSIVLHGFAGSSAEMRDLAARLPGRKLLPDLPGHGSAATFRDPASYRLKAVVESLVGLLDDEPVERADVVGYSMGGRVALGMAALAPHRIRSVVAIGARAGIVDTEERAARRADDETLAAAIEEHGADWFAEEWVDRPLYDTQRRLGPAHIEQVLERRRDVDPTGLALSLP